MGELGDGTKVSCLTPPTADVLSDGAFINAEDSAACVVTASGGVRCWGKGPLGAGFANDENPTPSASDVVEGAATVAIAMNHACAVTTAAA